MINHRIKSLRYRFRTLLSQYPALHLQLLRRQRPHTVSHSTEVVIEGFPRSGNTFAVAAFRMAQTREVEIAHHTHAPAQVLWAVEHEIPTIVLIRAPEDAVISFHIRSPWISLDQGLSGYCTYYRSLESVRHQVVVADFVEVIADFSRIIEKTNVRYSSQFAQFDHTEENVAQIFAQLEAGSRKRYGAGYDAKISRPSQKREDRKRALAGQLHQDTRLSARLQEAEAIYFGFTEHEISSTPT